MYKIENDIPVPPNRSKNARNAFTDAVKALDVGQSFFVEMLQANVCTRANIIAKATGRKFTTRKVEGGIRIWRVE